MQRAETPGERSHRRRRLTPVPALLFALALLAAAPPTAGASGPRWVTGPPYFTASSGQPVVWFTTQPRYFTDPGDLSASVNHAAADALVAAAAGVWNVPTSAMVLAYGGALDEHVGGANTYFGDAGLVFPVDVQNGNYATKQIAIIYDRDGSVTDLAAWRRSEQSGRMSPERRNRERRRDLACGDHPTRSPGAERPLHRPCARATTADAVSTGASLWPGARHRLVADQR
jgi:hypothetical protein